MASPLFLCYNVKNTSHFSMSSDSIQDRMTKARVKLLKKSPFFGTLLINAPWREDTSIPTAATDGRGLMFNPDFVKSLNDKQLSGLTIHEILHCALAHVPRMRDLFKVDPTTANIAADIVVNGIIDDNNFDLPDGAIRDNDLKHLSVREIYNILKEKQSKDKNYMKNKYGVNDVNVCLVDGDGKDQFTDSNGNKVEAPDWRDVINKASTIARMKKAGPVGAGLERIFKELLEPTIDWRTILYKYITETRNDFDGYDRRFAYKNLYIDDFSGSKVNVLLYIDVSGSISEEILTEFMSEINGAINSINEVTGEVYCFDTKVHHVCSIDEIEREFKLIGGGGTCFKCIFESIEAYEPGAESVTLPIILTDGYADLEGLPRISPLLWCITPSGIDSSMLPDYFDVTRIIK